MTKDTGKEKIGKYINKCKMSILPKEGQVVNVILNHTIAQMPKHVKYQ